MNNTESSDNGGKEVEPSLKAESAPQQADKSDVAVVATKRLEHSLRLALEPLLRANSAGQVRTVVAEAVRTSSRMFSGPIPPPETFAEYDAVVPGSGDRILKMAEKEQDHRHTWEKSHLRWDGWTNVVALSFGWLLSIGLAGGAIYCATISQPVVGTALVGASAFGAIAQFISGRRMFTRKDHAPSSQSEEQRKPKPPVTRRNRR